MSSLLVGSTDCILLVKNIPGNFTEADLLACCESICHPCIVLHSQLETGGCYTVKLLAPSSEAVQKISTMIDGMRSDQYWILTEVRPWSSLNSLERSQYPAQVLLDTGMLNSLRLSLVQPIKIQDLDRQIADLKVELAGYQQSSGSSGSREMIQVIKLVNEFLRAAKATTPTAYEAAMNLVDNITSLRKAMSNPEAPPTVAQVSPALSACFVPLFQHLNSIHQALLTTKQELEATTNELATVKATNKGLQQQISPYTSGHSPRTLPTGPTELQKEVELWKKKASEDQARLTAARQENKKLRSQNLELKRKVESLRERNRLYEEQHSTSASGGSSEPPDMPRDNSTSSPQERNKEIQVLEWEQKYFTCLLERERNMRLGVELELADFKVQYEMQEETMIEWFLESVKATNGEEYLKQLKTLNDLRPRPPTKSRLLG